MKNTIIDELNNTGYVYRDNEDGTFDVCYDHDQDANFTGVNMFHVATVKEEATSGVSTVTRAQDGVNTPRRIGP